MAQVTAEVAAETASPKKFVSMRRVRDLLDEVIDTSVADETEVVWFERRHGESHTGGESRRENPRLTILIRVVEGGRLGWHRTEVADLGMLQNGVRHALAVATAQPKVRQTPVFPSYADDINFDVPLIDRTIAALDASRASKLLDGWCAGCDGRLHWSETRVAVVNSHGLRRAAGTTEVSLDVSYGMGPGAGRAAGSARRLDELQAERIVERARHRRATVGVDTTRDGAGGFPDGGAIVFSPEATIQLLEALNIFAFAGRAFLDGSSFLSQHRNVQVFDRSLHVRDDGHRIPGMAFPFDLEGVAKRPVDLVVEGQPSTPALNRFQGGQSGLEPTGHSVGGQDAMFGNLFLLPGASSERQLIEAADGGLWVSWLETPECIESARLEVRIAARGVRRIEGGRLGRAVPDVQWETSLLSALARVQGIGNQSVVRAMPSTPLGGISAPALALFGVDGLSPLGATAGPK